MPKTPFLALVAVLLALPTTVLSADDLPAPGIARLYRADLLPRFQDSVFVGSVSSYDRTSGNDDGFSGKYSFVAKEGQDLVLADLKGPGVIYRIWTPTPTEDVFEFFFDGETEPRIRVKFRDLFTGKQPPFVSPMVGYGAGGFYCYTPLPYQKSCKIIARTQRVQFYQINYAQYADDAGITTWSEEPSDTYLENQQKAQALFAAAGSDVASHVVAAGTEMTVHATRVSLRPGATGTLFEANEGGRIAGIRILPASALAGKDRAILLRATWDDQSAPAILCPAGDFFGYAWGRPAMKSLLVGTSGDTSYCYFPMPYDKSAKIELVSERTEGPATELRTEVIYAEAPKRDDEGKFYVVWRRENPTTKGTPFTFVDTQGQGHLVGCILQSQGMTSGNTSFFEGDDQTTIDGQLTIHGTGSEDFFNGGWYDVPDRWEKQLSFPLSGCLGYQKHLGRTGGYRLMLGDVYAFRKSLLHTIEHAPTNNDLVTDYVGVTYLYMEKLPSGDRSLPPMQERAVVDFTSLVFTPDWGIPITAFTFRKATLSKMDETVAGQKVGFLRMTADSKDNWFGAPFLGLECDFPTAGKYQVAIEAVRGPKQACIQLFRYEVPAGPPVDLYAAERSRSGLTAMGTIDVDEGPATLMFKLVDKNEAAEGLSFDLSRIHCTKKAKNR